MENPFEERANNAASALVQKQMDIERSLRFLVNCEAGQWLLSELINRSHQFGLVPRYGNNKDNTIQGAYDLIESIITTPLLRHIGPEALTKLRIKGMKGNI